MKTILLALLTALAPVDSEAVRVQVDVETSEGWEAYDDFASEEEAEAVAVKLQADGYASKFVTY
jgi:hypothetical protein